MSHSFGDNTSRMSETVPFQPEIYCFGDSLTQRGYSENGCWLSLLSNELIRRCDVTNRGFSGYNSRWCHMILPRILNKERAKNIACAIVFLGANDATLKDLDPAQHVPVDEYKDELISIVEYFQLCGVEREKIILMAPPPCDVEKYTVHCKENGQPMSKSLSQTKAYAEACCKAAEETGVESFDVFSLMTKVDDWPKFLSDGLHFSKLGSEFLFNTLWPSIASRTKHLPTLMPDWKDIDPNNPTTSLTVTDH